MIRHIQTDTSRETGNCLKTAIACVLDADPEQIPDFLAPEIADWDVALYVWSQKMNVTYMSYLEDPAHSFPYRAFGYTPRNTYHAVVYQEGRLLHDVHPDNTGLVSANFFIALTPR